MIKVLHVIESLDSGGAERVLLNLIRFNPRKDIEHAILCLSQEGDLADEFKQYHVPIFVLDKKVGFDWTILFKMREVIYQYQPHFLHTHLFTGNLWGRLASKLFAVPSVMSVQNDDSWIEGSRLKLEKLLAKVPVMTIGVSESALKRRDGFGLNRERACLISNAAHAEAIPWKREEVRQEFGVHVDHVVVGVLARCVPQKNVELFVEIAQKLTAQYNELTFVWCGGGESLEAFRMTHSGSSSRIKFIGHQTRVMEVLSMFDVMISTSHREGFSLSLIEGMLTGLPVLATRVSGNIELMENFCSDCLSEGDALQWFEKQLKELIESEDKRKILGQDLQKKAETHYSVEVMAEKYAKVYEDLS